MAHSYTSLRQFQQCPRQYHEVRVLKRFPYVQSPEAVFGEEAHKALELAGTHGTPLPEKFAPYQWAVDGIMAQLSPDAQYEYDFSFSATGSPVAPNAWAQKFWSGKADVFAVSADTAIVVDWKTGKSGYPDKAQLELMAYFAFMAKPEVNTVHGVLVFLQDAKLVTHSYYRKDITAIHTKWWDVVREIKLCEDSGAWEEKPSALCPWCPVTECSNWSPPKPKK